MRDVARWLLGVGLVLTGTAHLTVLRVEFQAQVPRWMPIGADAVVLASGVVEIALGVALLVVGRRHRRTVGVLAALLFVAVFPGNLWQYLDRVDGFGLDTDGERFTRLWFQPLLVLWALWSTRPRARRRRSLPDTDREGASSRTIPSDQGSGNQP